MINHSRAKLPLIGFRRYIVLYKKKDHRQAMAFGGDNGLD
jgi:hypothetical protein